MGVKSINDRRHSKVRRLASEVLYELLMPQMNPVKITYCDYRRAKCRWQLFYTLINLHIFQYNPNLSRL
ncbi:hypothetical protein D3C87_1095140 [compost metagenome]